MSSQIQALYAPTKAVTPETGYRIANIDPCEVFFGWRNHPNLLRWFEMLYQMQENTSEPFRGTSMVLSGDDLDALERDIRAGKVPPLTCPNCTDGGCYSLGDDLEFIDVARAYIAGDNVILIFAFA